MRAVEFLGGHQLDGEVGIGHEVDDLGVDERQIHRVIL